jgi:hypothetical protein
MFCAENNYIKHLLHTQTNIKFIILLNKIAYVNMYIKARLTNCPNYEIFGEYWIYRAHKNAKTELIILLKLWLCHHIPT